MSEKPHLHLDFNSPACPAPAYSPPTSFGSPPSPFGSFTSQQYSSPFMPSKKSFSGIDSERGELSSPTMSEKSLGSPTRSSPRILMGAVVSVSPRRNSEELSLEVPGIVLTEPHPNPRPFPPPKQTVLLAPTSLPLPPPGSSLSNVQGHYQHSSISAKSAHQFSPAFTSFLNGTPTSYQQHQGRKSRMKALVMLGIVIVGGWHLWSTMMHEGWGGLVEEAVEVM
ncbi:hypothetical protein I307_04231 [Cryptococcus deuterogattii 99/473]|uniref:Unplaced genomic scaffold supercont1.2, whole genome shotgun sequence n=1 Tax=Cryptococcus deuterogattii Ram5 TaxID=1296110 RepID=A0A0D0VE51_9TREE|nr:hypothetical protein I309_04636 [Cryptococcus deuterogattii LA55]KIR35946.1 hypothetical protein I352_00888 [Cryptococcus deuterogattii MMRL2647]KIR43095.1 hypothetical protein I313_01304 [Cryptococcus deuterogattii Ram5]KIR95320.1 hypothetical protein I304_00069 [Cryptococcus deuterogattii CBS 10090]KIY56432.1 hypothetical protein I307_04231 [Cryptococcus deuterogattii 99/473]